MPEILKPNAKALLWAALGFFVAPMLLGRIGRK
jgi:hypothetical protein